VCVSLNISRCDCRVKRMPHWLFWTVSPATVQFCQQLQLQLLVWMKVNLNRVKRHVLSLKAYGIETITGTEGVLPGMRDLNN
jgi:hypothetical protein